MILKKSFIGILLIFPIFLSAQSKKFGTTIITHGFQLTGETPINPNNKSSWVIKMAEAIIERANGGKILVYKKQTGRYQIIKSKGFSGETVLLFDWAAESNNNSQGYSEAAGDALFSSLLLGNQKRDFELKRLHFIGHSRGTVVNSSTIERLLVLLKSYPNLYPISIEQVTNLDPHDWGFKGIATDYDIHPNRNIPCPQNSRSNNGTIAWEGSGFNDSYYQIGNASALLDGRPVKGTFNCDWSKIAIGHSEVHRVYTASIRDFRVGNSTPCKVGGYQLSRIGGNNRPLQDIECNTTMIKSLPNFNFFIPMKIGVSGERIRGIMNGSFDRGDGNSNMPGWEEHGGKKSFGGVYIKNQQLIIEDYTGVKPFIVHNRFFIPKDAISIEFKQKSFSPNKGILKVYISNELVKKDTLEGLDQDFSDEMFNIEKYQNQIVSLKFEFESLLFGGNAKAIIDEIRLSKKTKTSNSTLFLFDLSGSMNDNGGGSIPKIEQAKQASKTTLNGLASNSQGVKNQVAVYGFNGGCTPDPTIEVSPFTDDLVSVETKIKGMNAGGSTPLSNALRAAECKMAAHLQKEGQQKGKLIILSDGQGTCGNIRPNGVYNSAPLQKNRSVMIDASQCGGGNSSPAAVSYYTVGFNISPGSPAERDLQYLSQISGGKYLNVQNQTQLVRAFRKFNRVYQPKLSPALSGHPNKSIQDFSEGVTKIKEEYFGRALTVYETFTKAHPDDCHGYYNLALAQEANDFYKEAIENYQQYLTICPDAFDRIFVENQISFLEDEFREFVLFQKEVVRSDLEFLNLHFQKIQNGQSVVLASEFKGFLQEKGDYYEMLPRLIASGDSELIDLAEDITSAFQQCAKLIRKNPQSWDQNSIPLISMNYLNLEELLELL